MSPHGVSVRKDKGMAKIYPRGGKLYIDYEVDGVRKRKSTKLDDTKENRALVEKSIIPNLMRMIVSGEIYKKKPKTFGHYFDIFLKSKDSIRSYDQKLSHRMRVKEEFESMDIDTITRLDIKRFIFDMPILSRSKGIYLSTLAGVFEMAVDDGVIAINPALDIKLPKDDVEEIEYFTKEEVKTILENAEDVMKGYLMIAFHTGMRPEEILGLQWGDIGDTHISIKRVKTYGKIYDKTKTTKSTRVIPYPSFILPYINILKGNSVFIFDKERDSRSLYKRWYKLLEKCEIPKKKLYSTRHTFATTMLRDGVLSLNELAGMLGHTTPRTTLTSYASIIDGNLIELGRNFDPYGSISSQSKNETPSNVAK